MFKTVKSNELTESEGSNKALLVDQAEKYSTTYTSRNNLITSSVALDKIDDPNLMPSNDLLATAITGGKKGFFVDLPIIDWLIFRQEMLAAFPLRKRGILLASVK